MSQIADSIEVVKAAADKVGVAELARAANVPYTTVRSFADRGWSNKNLKVLDKLIAAARRLGEAA